MCPVLEPASPAAAVVYETVRQLLEEGIEAGTLTRKLVTMAGHGLNMAFCVYRQPAPKRDG